MIRLITLDLDGTLWNIWPTIARAEHRLYQWLASHYPRISAAHSQASLRELNRQFAEQHPQLAHDVTALRRGGLALAAQQAGYRDFRLDQGFEVFLAERQRVELFADTLPLLRALNTIAPLVALTNGNACVRRMQLSDYFHFQLSARDAGCMKPATGIFHLACRMAGATAAQTVHIGDDYDADIVGAHRAGVRSIWFHPDAQPPATDMPAAGDAHVTQLMQIPTIIRRWAAAHREP